MRRVAVCVFFLFVVVAIYVLRSCCVFLTGLLDEVVFFFLLVVSGESRKGFGDISSAECWLLLRLCVGCRLSVVLCCRRLAFARFVSVRLEKLVCSQSQKILASQWSVDAVLRY